MECAGAADGGLRQLYVPKELDELEALGYIRKTDHVDLDDVVARIPATGRPVPDREVP